MGSGVEFVIFIFYEFVHVLFRCLGCFFFQAEDGIRDLVRSRGLGDVYKRQVPVVAVSLEVKFPEPSHSAIREAVPPEMVTEDRSCLLYTSDAADDLLCVDLGGRRIIKKKKHRVLPDIPDEHLKKH